TNEQSWTWRTPAATRPSRSLSLSAVEGVTAWFCRPSRRPTSTRSTRRLCSPCSSSCSSPFSDLRPTSGILELERVLEHVASVHGLEVLDGSAAGAADDAPHP